MRIKLLLVVLAATLFATALRAQQTTDCVSDGAHSQCAAASSTSLTSYTTCAGTQCTNSAIAPMPMLGVGLKTTHCASNGSETECVTTSPTELTTYTSCHSAPSGMQCETPSGVRPPSFLLSPVAPTPEQRAQDQAAHQAEIQNEARGAVFIGKGVVGLFHAMGRASKKEKERQIADLGNRSTLLLYDIRYGDTLVARAKVRGDTVAVRRLSADQLAMNAQFGAMLDSIARLQR